MLCRVVSAAFLLLLLSGAAWGQARAADDHSKQIIYLGSFQSPSDVKDTRTHCQQLRDFFDKSTKRHSLIGEKPAVCDKVVNVIAGTAASSWQEPIPLLRAAKVTTDSHQRVIVTEPLTRSVQLYDFLKRKYTRIEASIEDRMLFPYAVAVDAENDLYVTDLQRGTIAVFSPEGKFKRYIGDYKGEQAFEQPSSIAVDQASGRIYVADVKRHFVVILDRDGNKLVAIGKRGGGSGPGQFKYPTELVLHDRDLFVLDKRNSRIQVLDLDGRYKREIRIDSVGADAPRGMAIDSQGRIYILLNVGMLQVLSKRGQALFQFGHYGTGAGEFEDAAGIYIDSADRLYVSDTGNQRVQVFQIAH